MNNNSGANTVLIVILILIVVIGFGAWYMGVGPFAAPVEDNDAGLNIDIDIPTGEENRDDQ